jgi:hypothetical protein
MNTQLAAQFSSTFFYAMLNGSMTSYYDNNMCDAQCDLISAWLGLGEL